MIGTAVNVTLGATVKLALLIALILVYSYMVKLVMSTVMLVLTKFGKNRGLLVEVRVWPNFMNYVLGFKTAASMSLVEFRVTYFLDALMLLALSALLYIS